ncbi:Aminopeptidase N [Pelomyxa schiedti]|nr:Aminopeptidase N [Pelomyxa schiedti]
MGKLGNLTCAEAEIRRGCVSGVTYRLHVSMSDKTYAGDCTITFNFTPPATAPRELFLDFVTANLKSATLNTVEARYSSETARLYLPTEALVTGQNTVLVRYENEYDHDGEGLHEFTDPQSALRYYYTNFEPFDAHRLLPCFDQPSIRAALSFRVTAPSGWMVVANSKEVSREPSADGTSATITFADTPAISTYLYALIVGPYYSVSSEYVSKMTGTTIPLRILCRQSMQQYLLRDVEELLRITKQGLAWYEDFFDMPFPFSKYDQIFCPEFNQGAMENVGAVTFTEVYLYPNPPTEAQRARRCETVLHEMAHMWFGNLVSPIWWDGLWLNESFATYISFVSKEATEFAEFSWLDFNGGKKLWGFKQDQLSTTHPIQGTVVDTASAFLNFDGITYGKGASVLKQLVFVIGMEAFRTGMRKYFRKHQWSNTSAEDFLASLESPPDWAEKWLKTAGLNTIEPEIRGTPGSQKLIIKQSAPPSHPTLRSHALQVAIYDQAADGTLSIRRILPTVVPALPEIVLEGAWLQGEPIPAFVHVNHGDHAYGKFCLNQESLAFVLAHMNKLTNPLTRQQMWLDLYGMVRDAKLPATHFLSAVVEHLTKERNMRLLSAVLLNVGGILSTFVPDAMIPTYAQKLYSAAMSIVNSATGDFTGLETTWSRYAVAWSYKNKSAVEELFGLMSTNPKWITQDLRWNILQASCSWNIPGAIEAAESDGQRDSSAAGVRALMSCRSSVWSIDVKRKMWDLYLKPSAWKSLHEASASMNGFNWFHQRDVTAPFIAEFFTCVRTIYADHTREYANAFFSELSPWRVEDDSVLGRGKVLLASLTDSPSDALLRTQLNEWIDRVEMAKKCRAIVSE